MLQLFKSIRLRTNRAKNQARNVFSLYSCIGLPEEQKTDVGSDTTVPGLVPPADPAIDVPAEASDDASGEASDETTEPTETITEQAPKFAKKGGRRALLIGSNYPGTDGELMGCLNDLQNMKTVLENLRFGQIEMIADNETLKPTRETILSGLKQFLNGGTGADELLYVHFSGHGTQSWALFDKTETDMLDECICTVDSKLISDNELNRLLRENLRTDSRLYIVFDCCHSGSMLDLNFEYNLTKNGWDNSDRIAETAKCGHIVMLSGCRDQQTSMDSIFATKEGLENQGALTFCLVSSIEESVESRPKTIGVYSDLLKRLAAEKMKQHPLLTSNQPFDVENVFLS